MNRRRNGIAVFAIVSALLLSGYLIHHARSSTRSLIRVLYPPGHRLAPTHTVKDLFGGDRGLATITAPDEVTLSVLGDVIHELHDHLPVETYPVVGGPVALPPPQ